MKTSKTISIDAILFGRAVDYSVQAHRTFNRLVEDALHEYIERRREPQMLACARCGSLYSETLGACPVCESGKVAVAKRSRLVLELEGVAKTLIAAKEQVGRATTKLKNMESFLDDGKATEPEIEKAAEEQKAVLAQLAVVQGEYDRLEREIEEIEKNSERGVLE